MADGALQPEILWGTSLNTKYPAKNILVDEAIFNNKTHANYWLAHKRQLAGQGFVMKVGNSKRKIVGISIRNSYHTGEYPWATKEFELEGSLLKEPEREGQRSQDANLLWTPDVLKAGNWSVLLTETLEGINMNPSLENFFFEATTELRYLWFHLRSYYGSQGGGLNYLGPILQSGESPSTTISPICLFTSDVCAWTNWTTCDWFCDEEDPGNSTRYLQHKENTFLQDASKFCKGDEVRGCYENCTGEHGHPIEVFLRFQFKA